VSLIRTDACNGLFFPQAGELRIIALRRRAKDLQDTTPVIFF